MPLLQIQQITKSFGPVTAVDHVSLDVAAGEIVCLLGPSGCGKTTLLRLVAGLEAADSGRILYEGRDVTAVPPHERGFGMMFQNFALFPHKNVFENIAFGLRMRGDGEAAVRARVAAMLDLVDLEGLGEREITQLSGGQQQRVALARALAPNPHLLMLDEPLGALDRALREKLMLEIRAILKGVGVTAVYVTHDQTEAFAVSDQIVVMEAGRIVQKAAPEVIYAQPNSEFVARFLGFDNLLAGVATAAGVETAVGLLPAAVPPERVGQKVTVLIRPDAAEPAAEGVLTGKVEAVSFRGRYYEVVTNVAGERLVFEVGSAVAVGGTVAWRVDPQKVTLIG